jgi:hypothetical protein
MLYSYIQIRILEGQHADDAQVQVCLDSKVHVMLGTIPSPSVRLPALQAIRSRSDVVIVEVTPANRDALAEGLSALLAHGMERWISNKESCPHAAAHSSWFKFSLLNGFSVLGHARAASVILAHACNGSESSILKFLLGRYTTEPLK